MLPRLASPPDSEKAWFSALADLARYLRSPEGCPWDREQTSLSFAKYVAEEAQELVEALEQGDASHAEEEWGDVLFVLLACAAASESEGKFEVGPALEKAHEKMLRRHDHVFGENRALSAEEAIARWDAMKAVEREKKG